MSSLSPEIEALVESAVQQMALRAAEAMNTVLDQPGVFIGAWADFLNPPPILPDGMEPCGKHWHKSREEAEAEIKKMKPSRGPAFILNSYYCYGCDGFHVGHTLKKRTK